MANVPSACAPAIVAPGAGAAPPARTNVLELNVGELRQLFNAMDPAPFRERNLDPNAEEYIVDWAREVRGDAPLGLVVHLRQQAAPEDATALLRDAMHDHFTHRANQTRMRLKRLFRVGRITLAIGVLFVAAANLLGDLVSGAVGRYGFGQVLADSVAIGSWVALWRPLEIFLYDWWPLRDEARLYDRLAAMDVRVVDAVPAAYAK